MIGCEGGERVRSQRQRCTPRLTCSEQLSREDPGEEGRGIGRTMAIGVPGCGQLTELFFFTFPRKTFIDFPQGNKETCIYIKLYIYK